MRSVDRQTMLLGMLLLALLVVSLWSFGSLADARDTAEASAADAVASRQLASRIAAGSGGVKPFEAADEASLGQIGRIERAATSANLGEGTIERIGTEQQRRLDSDTIERTRQIYLRDLTLEQLVRFLHNLTGNAAGLRISSLRLSAPRGEEADDPEQWNAEVETSYVAIEPLPSGRR